MNFYFEAAKVLDRLDAKQGSIMAIVGSLPEKERKRTAALVIETLRFRSVLTDVINASSILRDERKKITSLNLALVLVHDILLCNGIQAGDGPIKQAILRHKTRLSSEFQRIKVKQGVKSNEELAQTSDDRADHIPRYVRVNTIKWTTDEAIRYFTSRGFDLSNLFESRKVFQDAVLCRGHLNESIMFRKGFSKDSHIPDLLLFNPKVQFHDDPSYVSGMIILQDKASCFPAIVLDPPATDDAVVIDAAAAPGNKTSHLSALMDNKGTLYAFERDKKRFSTLKTMIAKSGGKNVCPVHIDFLTVSPTDTKYSSVTHILLDPSCSGSGIVNRLNYLTDTGDEHGATGERLNKLAAFQLMMVKHAMKFPSAKRIVYSTCSIHTTENEHVVRNALDSDEARAGGFRLASRNEVLPMWHRRGLPEEMGNVDDASSMVRCLAGEDATNGFFVACFVKDERGYDTIAQKRKIVTTGIGGPTKKKKKR